MDQEKLMFEPGQYFQHKDGGIYEFIKIVRYSDRPNEKGVEYLHRWPFDFESWVRPIEEWTSARFTPITVEDAYKYVSRYTLEEGQELVKANKQRRKELEAS